jgi:hypothetical protein
MSVIMAKHTEVILCYKQNIYRHSIKNSNGYKHTAIHVRFQVVMAASMKFRVFVLMMEAVRTPETFVNFNVTTWRYIPEDSRLQTVIQYTVISLCKT